MKNTEKIKNNTGLMEVAIQEMINRFKESEGDCEIYIDVENNKDYSEDGGLEWKTQVFVKVII